MTTTLTDPYRETKTWMSALFAEHSNGERDHPFQRMRRAALNRLLQEDFPTRRDEDWKYTSVAPVVNTQYQLGEATTLTAEAIEPFLFQDLNAIRLVFVNGVLDEALSDQQGIPPELELQPVKQALKNEKWQESINEQIALTGTTDKNPFLDMNLAFSGHGLAIRVPRNFQLDRPIHLLYLATASQKPVFFHPQLILLAEPGSDVQLIESYHGLENAGRYFCNTANWIVAGANARVRHHRIQAHGPEATQINNTITTQQRDSNYFSFAFDLGGRLVRNNLSTGLKASGTESYLYGIYLADGQQHIDNQTFVDHAFPHCNSNELYKGILTGKARGVFNGKVLVRPDAQKTNAFQQSSSLVLSPTAVMDSKPQLEIFADDVRCSHGATIGQLDESAVFYLRSRGLSEAQARGLLQIAFVSEVSGHINLEPVRARVERMIEEKMNT